MRGRLVGLCNSLVCGLVGDLSSGKIWWDCIVLWCDVVLQAKYHHDTLVGRMLARQSDVFTMTEHLSHCPLVDRQAKYDS
jgi:hypothetical protein